MEGLSTTKSEPKSLSFLTKGEGEPFIPASICAVVAFGVVTSVYLLGNQPLASSPEGAWGHPASCVTDSYLVPRGVLRWFRTLVFVHFLGINAYMLRRGFIVFYFYTNWTWVLETTYFGLAARLSWQARKQPPAGKINAWQHTALAMFHVCLAATVTVDAITWGMLWPMLSRSEDPARVEFYRSQFFSFTSYNTHGANVVLLMVELLLNAMPFEPYLLGWMGLYSSAFALWAFSYYKATNRWMYPFMDASRPAAFATYAGIYVGHWFFLGLLYCLWRLKAGLLALTGHRKAVKQR